MSFRLSILSLLFLSLCLWASDVDAAKAKKNMNMKKNMKSKERPLDRWVRANDETVENYDLWGINKQNQDQYSNEESPSVENTDDNGPGFETFEVKGRQRPKHWTFDFPTKGKKPKPTKAVKPTADKYFDMKSSGERTYVGMTMSS